MNILRKQSFYHNFLSTVTGKERLSSLPLLRYNRLPEVAPEVSVPARDQIQLKTAKPKRPEEIEHVKIEKDKAHLAPVVQKPEVPPEVNCCGSLKLNQND